MTEFLQVFKHGRPIGLWSVVWRSRTEVKLERGVPGTYGYSCHDFSLRTKRAKCDHSLTLAREVPAPRRSKQKPEDPRQGNLFDASSRNGNR